MLFPFGFYKCPKNPEKLNANKAKFPPSRLTSGHRTMMLLEDGCCTAFKANLKDKHCYLSRKFVSELIPQLLFLCFSVKRGKNTAVLAGSGKHWAIQWIINYRRTFQFGFCLFPGSCFFFIVRCFHAHSLISKYMRYINIQSVASMRIWVWSLASTLCLRRGSNVRGNESLVTSQWWNTFINRKKKKHFLSVASQSSEGFND